MLLYVLRAYCVCAVTNSFSLFPLFPLFFFPLLHKPKAQVEAKKEHEGAVQLLEVRSSGFPGLLQVPPGQEDLQPHHSEHFRECVWNRKYF